ncbi:MAG: gamma-glutamyl-gamma-aminobutyrate hydrolase family protein [Deltaproteobacteria bacterium]|nr:gamma-glutamyl-gamma-aminobutyrate hydrolase family protein [Deltaproteobacteria bacterium]
MKPRAKRIVVIVALALVLAVCLPFAGFRMWVSCSAPADAPVIGMSADSTVFNQLGMTSATYETAVVLAGGRPRGVRAGDEVDASLFLDGIDGLYLTGGGDVDPDLFGGDPQGTLLVNPARDELELALIEGALDRGMPILGICRGAQILNVALGGTLRVIRLDEDLASTHFVSLDSFSAHSVSIVPATLLHAILGQDARKVNSFHGNAVETLGKGLRVSARAADGVIEAVEADDGRFILGIQWHPDLRVAQDDAALSIFEAFVDAAAAYRAQQPAPSPVPSSAP